MNFLVLEATFFAARVSRDFVGLLGSGSALCRFGVCLLWVRGLSFVGSRSAFCGFGVCLPGQNLTQNPEPGGLFSIEIDLFLPLDFFESLEASWVRGLAFSGFGVCLLWVYGLPLLGSWSAFVGWGSSGFMVCLFWVHDLPLLGSWSASKGYQMCFQGFMKTKRQ